MLKRVKFLCIILGVIFVVIGGYLLLLNHEDKKDLKDEKEIIVVNTSNSIGDKIDNSIYEFYEIDDEFIQTSFNSVDMLIRNKYIFYYPSNLKEYVLNSDKLVFENEFSKISTNYFSLEEFETFKLDLANKENYQKVNVSSSNKKLNISEYDVEYFKISSIDFNNIYNEEFIVAIKESNETVVTISFLINSKRFNDDFLTGFINKIEIKKGEATYLHSSVVGDFITGTLKQKDLKDNSRGYFLSYKLSNSDYREIESYRNSISSNTFSITNETTSIVNISLHYIENDNDFFNNYLNKLKKEFAEEKAHLEIKEINNAMKNYKGKDYYQIDIDFTNEAYDSAEGYATYIINKLDSNVYYIVIVDSNKKVSDEVILDFFDIDFQNIVL